MEQVKLVLESCVIPQQTEGVQPQPGLRGGGGTRRGSTVPWCWESRSTLVHVKSGHPFVSLPPSHSIPPQRLSLHENWVSLQPLIAFRVMSKLTAGVNHYPAASHWQKYEQQRSCAFFCHFRYTWVTILGIATSNKQYLSNTSCLRAPTWTQQ